MSSQTQRHPLDDIFHPRSVAIIGASANETRGSGGWVARLLDFGFSGQIYPINPRATEIAGLKAYPNVREIPGPVDYAIFAVPASLVPPIMEDCAVKRVKAVHIFTAGFSETGSERGEALQTDIERIAREANIRVIGPNCMGVYYPAGGLTFSPGFPKEPGSVAFVAQTGAGSSRLVGLAGSRGLRFSKVISYGNAIDLDAPDFLDYLATDEETKFIACYIEGVKDGRYLLESVRKCVRAKPVVILKAGLTEGGSGAAASHTAALSGSAAVWDAFFKQTGTIAVESLEEIIDMAITFLNFSRPQGRRVGIVGRGGGLGVIATDVCEKAGLRVPPYTADTRGQLEKLIPEAGASVRNPVETALGLRAAASFYEEGLKIVCGDPGIDFILTHVGVDVYGGYGSAMHDQLLEAAETLIRLSKTLTKPLAVVFYAGGRLETVAAVMEAQQRCLEGGLAVYSTIEAAAKAISRFLRYHEFIERGMS